MPRFPIAPRDSLNPFASRYIDPASRPYLLPCGVTWSQMADRLRRHNGSGQIVGPHGAGKSTFLHTLLAHLGQAVHTIHRLTLHKGEHDLPRDWKTSRWTSDDLVAIDGYEQLRRWRRRRLQWQLRRKGSGLIVTTHQGVNLPVLFTCQPSVMTLRRVVDQMTAELNWDVSQQQLQDIHDRCEGNLRECLFCLYDLYQLQLKLT